MKCINAHKIERTMLPTETKHTTELISKCEASCMMKVPVA